MASLLSKPTENARLPLGNRQKYPDLKEQDPFPPVSIEVKSTTSKSTVPPKPIPSPRSKPWRPRSGSAGSNAVSNREAIAYRLGQSYPLQRSRSSQSKVRPTGPENNDTRERSHSSSSVPCSSYANSNSAPREDSIKWLMSNLVVRKHKYGETHPKVGSAWNRIGTFFFRNCQYSHALDAYKHAVVCYQACEAELACTYANMGSVYWATGRPDKAMNFLQKALDLYELNEVAERKNPDESLAVAFTLYQMGLCNTLRKRYGEAMTCLKKCQKMQGTFLGPMDVQVGRTLDAIGKVHYFKQAYSTALDCHEEARRIKSASGGNETAVVTSLLNIAAVHHATKNWNVATAKYTRVMHLQKSELVRCRNQDGRHLARAAQEVGETLHIMGDMHLQMNQADQARRFYQEAALVYQEAGLTEDDPRMNALRQK